MLSKELLGAVLNKSINFIDVDENIVTYECMILDTFIVKYINIYELASKVKEWAKDKNFWLDSGVQIEPCGWNANCGYLKLDSQIADDFYADTEPLVIFKAGEWVLKLTRKDIK